jgi:hypothetical protein
MEAAESVAAPEAVAEAEAPQEPVLQEVKEEVQESAVPEQGSRECGSRTAVSQV